MRSAAHFNQLAFRAGEFKIALFAEDDPYRGTSHQKHVFLTIVAHYQVHILAQQGSHPAIWVVPDRISEYAITRHAAERQARAWRVNASLCFSREPFDERPLSWRACKGP